MVAAAPAGGLSPAQLRWLLGGLMMGLFLASAGQSIVATALPTIAGDLGGGNRLAWVVSAYLLTSTVVTPLYGKMSDLYGRRVVYQVAITVFGLGGLLGGFAETMTQLVLARAIQGMGGGGLMSLAFVIVADVVSARRRGRYIGMFTAVFTVSAVSGPLWGGLLVDGPGWRWVFWSVVPLSILTLAVLSKALRLPFTTRKRPIDWLGIGLLVVAATGMILVPIWGGQTYPWRSWPLVLTALVGVIGTVLFVAQERRAVEPVVPLRLFRDRTVVAIFAMGFCLMGALMAVTTFLPLFLQISTGVSATRSGLLMTPQSIAITLASAIGGALVSRTGRYKWTLTLGPLTAVVALFTLTFIGPDTGGTELAPRLFLLGLGLGLVFPNITLAVQNAAAVEDLGIATSTSNFFRNMGGAFGAAIAGAFFATRVETELVSRLGSQQLDELGGVASLIQTPRVVRDFPPEQRGAVVEAVSEGAGALYWWSIPLVLAVLVFSLFVVEKPLRTTSVIGGKDIADDDTRGGGKRATTTD